VNYGNEVEIDAPSDVVWEIFTDVERWPEWTASVSEATALDGHGIAIGRRFAIKQPRLPLLVWQVTAVTPGASWTWSSRTFGAQSVAVHEVAPAGTGRTVVRQRVEQRGVLAAVSAVLMGRLVRRYLALEAAGLKRRVEHHHRSGAAAS
jgi:uncharacterized membrane protein